MLSENESMGFLTRYRRNSKKPSGQAGTGPGPLEVIAAAVAIYIQQLTAGIKARGQAALQGMGVKLRCIQAPGGDLGLVKAAGAGDGEREVLA